MNVAVKAVYADCKQLREAIWRDESPSGIVTSLKLPNGRHQVLSCYQDDQWELPAHWFSSSVAAGRRILNFGSIPCVSLRREAKLVVWKWLWGQDTVSGQLRGTTVRRCFVSLTGWLTWLSERELTTHVAVTPLVAQQYVQHVKGLKATTGKFIGRSLTTQAKYRRLLIVEYCWKAFHGTPQQFDDPWPESSATHLARHRSARKPSTEIIPDEVLAPLAQYAEAQLKRADELLVHRDALEAIVVPKEASCGQMMCAKRRLLRERGYTPRTLSKALVTLRDCCWVLILITTGIRVHELLNIKRGHWGRRVENGEEFWFIGSRSEKTGEGDTQWLAPEIAIKAVKVLERLSEPAQAGLERDLEQARADRNDLEVHRLEALSGHVGFGEPKRGGPLSVLSDQKLNVRLRKLAGSLNLEWDLASHQFRRTFASYVVHHKLGDLRYLRDHFKHWSLDMTALYALNEAQDLELYDEIYSAFDGERQAIVGHWLEPDTPIAGGLAANVRAFRDKETKLRTFKSREEMVRQLSEQIYLRSTGIAWCTNDDGVCARGNCEVCEHGLIDDRKQAFWEGLYAQQIELREINDLGPGGNQTVERTITRCEQVLSELGADMQAIRGKVIARG